MDDLFVQGAISATLLAEVVAAIGIAVGERFLRVGTIDFGDGLIAAVLGQPWLGGLIG